MGLAMAVVATMAGMWVGGYQKGKNEIDSPTDNTVIRIIDGDTLELSTKQQIRLNNIAAAEEGRCGYEEAKDELEKLALGKDVRVEGDFTDRYGRLLGLVYTDDYLVNLEMVRSGWARYSSNETAAKDEIKAAGQEARENKLGVYGKCVQSENTQKPECSIKGNNRDGYKTKIYTFPGCKSYKNTDVELDLGDQWFCGEEEAVAAEYVKANDCFGKDY